MTASIYRINGVEYKIEQQGRIWEVYADCDCALGPHWHLLVRTRTRNTAETHIRLPAKVPA
jgi:hypothetical protein